MPKVSIIVPNYNHNQFLKVRIETILNQTFQDFEVILLDDCSTDCSLEVLNEYRNHPKVSRLDVNERNSGSTFKQWQKGIELAKGDLIWIAESDDWCEPTLLETLVNAFDMHSNLVLGYVQSYYIFDKDRIEWVSKQDKLEDIIAGNEFVKRRLLNGNAIYNASMALFKKSAYHQVPSDYMDFKLCGDWLFWINIALQGDVFVSGKILNYFRNHSQDVSGKSYQSGLNFIEELKVLFYLCDNNLISNDEFFEALNIRYLRYRNSTFVYSSDTKKKIDDLFLNDRNTRPYKHKLKQNYLRFRIRNLLSTLRK
ncbi:MAG: glycosyltransferase family A protein [Bacteroidales bacterium]